MENLIATILTRCSQGYASLAGTAVATLGKKAAGDWRFFSNLAAEENKTITLRKYDAVMGWFDANWPENSRRPLCLDDWKHVQQWQATHSYSGTPQDMWPRMVIPAGASSDSPYQAEPAE